MSNKEKLKTNGNCLICFAKITNKNSLSIFTTLFPEETTLANILQKIIKRNLHESQLPSNFICLKCFHLLQEFLTAEKIYLKIHEEIFKTFTTICITKEYEIPDLGFGCQTEEQNPEFPFCEIEDDNKESLIKDKVIPEKNEEKEETETNMWYKNDGGKRTRPLIHPCKLCGRLFRRPCEVRQHMLSHGGNKPYRCRECGKLFGSRGGAGNHTLKKHGKVDDVEIVIIQEDENASSSTNSSKNEVKTETHENIDHIEIDDQDYVDDDDEDDFEWKLDEKAKKNLEDSKEKKTSEVNVISTTKSKRKKTPRPPISDELECPTCGSHWRTKSELRIHIATHSEERPFICEICGQAYKHIKALKIHVGMHYGVNPFTCPHCNKSFTQKGALQRHLPIHTGDAPYQCELCGKRFVHHTSFNMHTLAHTGQKRFKCEICGQMLLSKSHLIRHNRVHTGERPYACPTCGKRFAQRYNLSAHQRVHEEVSANSTESEDPLSVVSVNSNKLPCTLCDVTFDRKKSLEHHMKVHHNNRNLMILINGL